LSNRSFALGSHYLARALLLAGFAFLVVHLVRTGNLNLYIAERMQFIVKLSALGLYAVAAHQFYLAVGAFIGSGRKEDDCDCLHEMPATWSKSLLLYGWFAIPLVIGYALPDGMLGSSMAEAKGVQFAPQTTVLSTGTAGPEQSAASPSPSLPSVPDVQAEEMRSSDDAEDGADAAESTADTDGASIEEELFPAESFTESYAAFGKKLVRREVIQVTDKRFIETLTTLDLYRKAFLGKTIEISGFVYRESGMPADHFGVSRFAVNCCSADATPYGVMAVYKDAGSLATDQWITVRGKLSTTEYNGIEIILIEAERIANITPPENPYVSPDFDFGLETISSPGEEDLEAFPANE